MLPSTPVLARRLNDLRTTLHDQGLDGLIVTHQPNLRYLLNHVGTAGIAVVTTNDVEFLVDSRYAEAVRACQASPEACPGLNMRLVPGSYEDALVECLGALGSGTIGFEARHVSVATYDAWRARLGPAAVRLRPTARLVEAARAVKDDFEVACLRRAAAGLTAVADAAFAALCPGVSEREVAGVIESALRAGGYERPAFDVIVASGPNGALPHHRAGTRRVDAGDLVVLDFGGVLDGYCSDLTRTVSVGPPSEDARRVHHAVLRAQRAAIAAVRPGVETSAVDRAARAVLESEGLGEAFRHGTGHGLGLEVHEEPRVARASAAGDAAPILLQVGMVVTIEPGAYLPGWGGVRIEDDMIVTVDGADVLTAVSYDLQPRGAGQQSGSAWT